MVGSESAVLMMCRRRVRPDRRSRNQLTTLRPRASTISDQSAVDARPFRSAPINPGPAAHGLGFGAGFSAFCGGSGKRHTPRISKMRGCLRQGGSSCPTPNLAEKMALFRHGVVGDLITSDLEPDALTVELKCRSQLKYRLPGARATPTYHWKTFQRWLYAAREGLAALKPRSRERGFALSLPDEARECLLDMRREHPSAAADILLDEAVRNGWPVAPRSPFRNSFRG